MFFLFFFSKMELANGWIVFTCPRLGLGVLVGSIVRVPICMLLLTYNGEGYEERKEGIEIWKVDVGSLTTVEVEDRLMEGGVPMKSPKGTVIL